MKDLVRGKGALATPNPKLGHPLAPKSAALVHRFYEFDNISRIMSGKKDFVSVMNSVSHPKAISREQLKRGVMYQVC